MTSIEERVSALLKAAPGDPPITLDPATVTGRPGGPGGSGSRAPRAWLLPLLAAAIVLAVAVTTAVVKGSNSGTNHNHTATSVPADPKSDARAKALAILRTVPLPPHAQRTDEDPAGLRRGGITQVSSLEQQASGVWLAPGTVADTVRFARAHPAAGFEANCTCGGTTVKWVTFLDEKSARAIDYVVVPFRSGVAIKVRVIVAYVPRRPAWTYLDDTATSVEVTIERVREASSTGGAPTVRRTLGGAATHRLAAVANGSRPQAPSTCRGPVLTIRSTDILVFHEPDHKITFKMLPANCPQFIVQASGHEPLYLEAATLNAAVLAALGLPPDYGR